MSFIEVLNTKVHYIKSGKGKTPVVLLHGWGQNTIMMDPIAKSLEEDFAIYNIDFLGFGESGLPNYAYGPDDYTKWLKALLDKLEVNNPIIVGHSFGGHIAMRFASKYQTRKLILTGAAGLKPKRYLDYYLKVYTYKLLKRLPFIKRKNVGSTDYQNANGIMKQVFVKVVNSYVNELIKDIKCPTLLIYGNQDLDTPLWMGKYLEKNIKDAGLVVFENRGHYAYFEEIHRFNNILNHFIKGDK